VEAGIGVGGGGGAEEQEGGEADRELDQPYPHFRHTHWKVEGSGSPGTPRPLWGQPPATAQRCAIGGESLLGGNERSNRFILRRRDEEYLRGNPGKAKS